MNEPYFISRADLMAVFPPRAARQFEVMQASVAKNEDAVNAGVKATGRLQDAAFLTLSANDELPNERVLSLGQGLAFDLGASGVTLRLSGVPRTNEDFRVDFVAQGDTEVVLPLSGTLATRGNKETLTGKTLNSPALSGLKDAADDAAANAAGVAVGEIYRTGSELKVRVA